MCSQSLPNVHVLPLLATTLMLLASCSTSPALYKMSKWADPKTGLLPPEKVCHLESGASEAMKKDCEMLCKGYAIKFDYDPKSFPKERKVTDEHYKRKMKKYEENETDEVVGYVQGIAGIDTYDIDGDGKEEIFAMFADKGWCGSHGCHFVLFKDFGNWYAEDGGCLADIVHVDDLSPSIIILPTKSQNHNDIVFCSGWGNWSIWRWDGVRYEYYRHVVFRCDTPDIINTIEEEKFTPKELEELYDRCKKAN
ncbi:exported hypothetical protein [Alphaproteobacteria bacterium]